MNNKDIEKELTKQEKIDRENENKAELAGFVDWNKFSLDDLCDILEKKYMFSSSGDALSIHKLIDFYRKHKI